MARRTRPLHAPPVHPLTHRRRARDALRPDARAGLARQHDRRAGASGSTRDRVAVETLCLAPGTNTSTARISGHRHPTSCSRHTPKPRGTWHLARSSRRNPPARTGCLRRAPLSGDLADVAPDAHALHRGADGPQLARSVGLALATTRVPPTLTHTHTDAGWVRKVVVFSSSEDCTAPRTKVAWSGMAVPLARGARSCVLCGCAR